MKFNCIKRQDGSFVPAYQSDWEKAKKIKEGEEIEISVRKMRNSGFHRKFFALLNLGFENQDRYDNFEDFRHIVTMKAGFFKTVETDRGVVWLPKSIAFEKMDNYEFEDLYSKVIDVIIKVLGTTKEDIEKELIRFF